MNRCSFHLRSSLQICWSRVKFFLRAGSRRSARQRSALKQSTVIAATALLSATLAFASPLATTTTLTTTASPVTIGTVITLTATVADANGSVLFGTVNFYDASAFPTLIGTAQLPTSGQAVIKLRLGLGSHSLTAAFQGTTADLSSTSAAQPMVVSGTYGTTTTLASSGTNAIYSLTVTTQSFGNPPFTGTIQFQDTSNSNITVATPASPTTGFTFASHVDYTAGSCPDTALVRDLNGDGIPDVVTTNACGTTVSVFLGNGDGTLQAQANYTVGSSPVGLVIGDFNRDGNLDLAVANSGSNTISVLMGSGSGTFATQVTYATGSNPQGLLAGDFNNDGNLDLVSVNHGANTVSLLLGSSTGAFGAKTDFAVGSGPYRATAASFNNNGKLDLAVTNYSANTVSILVGNGGGGFATHVDYATGASPFGVATADLNGDGKPDLVVGNATGPSVSVLLGNGDNTFSTHTDYSTLSAPREVAIADLNGDGFLDVVVGIYASIQQFSVLLGNGNGTLQSAVSYTANYAPQGIALADMNGDGRIDVVTGDYLNTTISVLLNEMTLTGTATPVSVYGNSAHAVNATYVAGTGDLHTGSSSTTTSLTGLYLAWATAPLSTVSGNAGAPAIQANIMANGSVYSASSASVQLVVTGPNSYSQTYTQSAASGVVTFSSVTTPSVAGTYTYTANFPGAYTTAGQVLATQIVTAPATALVFSTPYANPANAGVGTTITVTAQSSGSTLTNFAGLVTLSSSDPAANFAPQSYTFTGTNNGLHNFTVTLNTVGTQSLTASSGTLTSATQTGIVVNSYSTTTALSTTTSPVSAGTVVVLTATATDSNSAAVKPGVINFYDSAALPTLLASVPLNSSGIAVFPSRPGVATHTYTAKLKPNSSYPGSTSSAQTVVVNPAGNYITQSAIGSSGSVGAYTLTGTVNAFGMVAPTGNVQFQDTSNSNLALATAALGTGITQLAADADYTAGSNATGVAVADFNGDGIADIAVGNRGASTVSIFLGNGNGTFQSQVTYAVGSTPYQVVAQDFNGDGKLDLAVANNGSGTVSILLGNGNGTFRTQTTYATGANPKGIVATDFNNDGKMDLAVTNSGAGTVSILLGNGDGTFQTQVSYPVDSSPALLATADFNGDGNPDLAVPSFSTSYAISILLGNGDGTFQPKVDYLDYNAAYSVVVGDFNGDGIPDLAAGNDGGGSSAVNIFLGNGNGTFQPGVSYPAGTQPDVLVVADYNGDGKLDLAAADDFSTATITLLLGNGNGTFQSPITKATTVATLGYLAGGDFNGDGRPDLVATAYSAATIGVLLNEQTFTATATPVAAYGNSTHNVNATYVPGSQDAYATSSSTTVSLTGEYLAWATAPPASINAAAAPGTVSVNVMSSGALPSASTASVQLTVTGPGSYSQSYTQAAVAGVATFSTLPALSISGSYTYTANFTSAYTTAGQVTAAETVVATTPTQLNITVPYPGATIVGSAHPLTIAAEDVSGNIVPTFTGTVTLSSPTDSAATFNPASHTYVAGDAGSYVFQATLNTIGTQSLTAASSGLTSVTQSSIVVSGQSQTITFSSLANQTYGVSPITLTATASSGLAVTYSVIGPATVSGSTLTVTGAGTVTVTASQSGNSVYAAASSVQQNFTVARAVLTVTPASPTITYGQTVPAYTATIAPFVNGDTLATAVTGSPSLTTTPTTPSVAGTYLITAAIGTLAAANYSFTFVNGTLTINQATPTITWATPSPITYGNILSGTQLNATGSVPGTFVYTPAAGTTPATGSDTLSVAFTPTDTTDYTNANGSVTLTVNKATPTITWAPPSPISYGTVLSSTQLNATASVPGTFAYTPAAGTTPATGSDTLAVVFTPTDTTDYTTASASVTLTVNKATPSVTWAKPSPISFGTVLSSTQLNATASVPGTSAYTPAAGTTPATGGDTLSVAFTPTDTTDYTNASATVTLTVNKAAPTITWAAPSPITYGTTLSGTQLNATASVPGTFVYTPAAGTTPATGSDILSVAFTPTDTTDYTNASSSVTL